MGATLKADGTAFSSQIWGPSMSASEVAVEK
jgi:hypothetical protein